jgi:hypothetical protein
MINTEGKKRVEELRKEWVISSEEQLLVREQRLLQKLYECQDELGYLLSEGKKDPHYTSLSDLIKNLEKHLGDQQDIM